MRISWRQTLRWLLPSICPGCGKDTDAAGPVCRFCVASLEAAGSRPRVPPLQRFHAVAAFQSPLREVVLSFKYRGRAYLGRELAGWMRAHSPAWARESELVVPVPAPWARRVKRGYHPAHLLAVDVARRWNAPCVPGALRRRHGFPSQTELDRERRGENAARSFAAGWRRKAVVGKRVLLIDDVCTTGATLSACARLLMESGARAVDALVLAQEALGSGAKAVKPIVVAPILDDRLV